MEIQPYTEHEAEVVVFHAWGDGVPVGGPLVRHLLLPVTDEFRAGLKISQVEDGPVAADFAEWRRHAPGRVCAGDWQVEMTSAFGAVQDAAGVQLTALLRPGTPVVLVVRFVCADTGLWRLLQFHDCVVLPSDASDDAQWMKRSVKFSAGHLEEFKCGDTPALVPRLRGVIEWHHLGRCVRCWEYDAETDTLTEDPENVEVVGEETVRYVSIDETDGDVNFSYLAARTVAMVAGDVPATGIGWMDAVAFDVLESSGLIMAPGWQLETVGCAEPLLLPPSGRHWEHPQVVFRFLGRRYATIEAGVFALPAFSSGPPDAPMDMPIRIGGLLLYPEGGFIAPGLMLAGDGEHMLAGDGERMMV